MPRQESAQFRITLWPQVQIEPVRMRRLGAAELCKDGSVAWHRAAVDDDAEPKMTAKQLLPDEFVIRQLLEANFSTPEAVIAFVNEWGPIARLAHPVFGLPAPVVETPPEATKRSKAINWARDVHAYLEMSRWASKFWIAHQDSTTPPEWPEALPRPIKAVAEDWSAFSAVLNEGLNAFQVRLEYRPPFFPEHATPGLPDIDLYSAMCLQLFNMVNADAPVRTCANETCGRRYQRQIGRTKYKTSSHTTGTLYCSAECAKAQAQREYRRRQRGQK